jgi:hypothetical protein
MCINYDEQGSQTGISTSRQLIFVFTQPSLPLERPKGDIHLDVELTELKTNC